MNSLSAYALAFELDRRLAGCDILSIRPFAGGLALFTSSRDLPSISIFFAERGAEICFADPPPLPAGSGGRWPDTPLSVKEVSNLGMDRTLIMKAEASRHWSGEKEFAIRLDFSPGTRAISLFDSVSGSTLASYGSVRGGVPGSLTERQGSKEFSLLSLPQECPADIAAITRGNSPGGTDEAGSDGPGQETSGTGGKAGRDGPGPDTAVTGSWKSSRELERALMGAVEGLDPALARALSDSFGPDPRAVWKELHMISLKASSRDFEWHTYDLPGSGSAGVCEQYPVALPFEPGAGGGGFIESFEARCREQVKPGYISYLRKTAAASVKKDIKKLGRLHVNLSRDLEEASLSKEYRHMGNLLVTNRHMMKHGAKEITVRDFSGDRSVTIPLDPALGPDRNIRLYFRKARKGDKGRLVILNRRAVVEKILKEKKALRDKIMSMETIDDLAPLLAGRSGGKDANPRKGSASEPNFRRFRIDGDHLILVGRSDRENDELTHHYASPSDLWFHAQGISGSHVILRGASRSTPAKIIEAAASVAAWFSKARNSGTVPVIYTEKRYVRKPRGTKPGSARCEREKTLFVEPALPEEDPKEDQGSQG